MIAKQERPTVEEVLDEYDIQPNRSGMIQCPHHEDNTPSLKTNEDWWYCFSCNRSGDGIGLIAALEGASITDVLARYASDTKGWKSRKELGISTQQLLAGVKQQYRQMADDFWHEVHQRLADEPEWILLAVIEQWSQEFDDYKEHIRNEDLSIYQREQLVQKLRDRCNRWLEVTNAK